MSLRLEMLQVARLAPKLLGESCELVRDFILGQLNESGSFEDREGKSDLYYTVFGLDTLNALQIEAPGDKIEPFLRSFSTVDGLDLVHLCCLARCWAALPGMNPPPTFHGVMLDHLQKFKSKKGGFNNNPESEMGTVYGCFLALGAHQDLGAEFLEKDETYEFIQSMRTADGAYSNEPFREVGSTPATAAAISVVRNLGMGIPRDVGQWLEDRCLPAGGFLATPNSPIPDLLSTATALHALAGLEYPLDRIKEPCLDFIDSLWTNRGSFYGNWTETQLDCEYTFYGLLALGHLSL